MTQAAATTFHRTRFTWAAYAMLGFYAYGQNIFAPAMPFLREELNIGYTLGGMHASLFAVGMLTSGLVTDRLTERFGNGLVFWIGGAGMAFGLMLLVAVPVVAITLTAALIMGGIGSLLLNTINGSLAQAYPTFSSVALMEANILAYIVTAMVPLMVGGAERFGLGWRAAAIFAALAFVVMAFLFRDIAFPQGDEQETANRARSTLPMSFWLLWVGIFLSVSLEWSLALWSADFMHTALGVEKSLAASLVAVFIGAGVFGRIVSSRLARHYLPSTLLIASLVIVLIGFPLFWLGNTLIVNLIGLAISGFGTASLFPLGLAAATNAAPTLPARATSRVAVAGGLAILVNPQLLGFIADQVGIQRAFAVVPVVAALALIVVVSVRAKASLA